jgi:hypothetical protein
MKQAKRRIISVYYDYDADDTFVDLGLWFRNADNLTKLDVLADAIGDLNVQYGVALEKFGAEFRKD